MCAEIYLHGQILGTHSFLLRDGFVEPDEYAEIKEKYFLPGGETGTAATVLSSLGASVKMDGTHIGTEVAPLLKSFYANKSVDLSSICFDPDYAGLMDYVVIAGLVRSPMGFFQTLYASGIKRWNDPKEQDIVEAKVVGIDPYFMESTQMAAELCVKHGSPLSPSTAVMIPICINIAPSTLYPRNAPLTTSRKAKRLKRSLNCLSIPPMVLSSSPPVKRTCFTAARARR